MNKTRSAMWVLVLVVGVSAGAFAVRSALAPTSAEHAHEETGHAEKGGEESAHGHEDEEAGHGAEKGQGEEGHADGAEAHAEEGLLSMSEAQIKAGGIELAPAEARALSRTLAFPGEILFDENRTAHVVPRVAGVVESVHADLGQTVKKGDLLAVVASQQISEQRSEQDAAQRRLELARLTFERERQLWQDKISAEQDYQLARQALQEAEIALKNLRQKGNALGAGTNPNGGNRYELRAPFDGVIVEKHLALGEVVSETSNAFIISDLSRVWASFSVPPKDLDKVLVDKTVKVSAPELDAQVDGKISYVGSLLGEQTRMATVRVNLQNPQGSWRPGLFVTVRVAADSRDVAVSIPQSAVQTVEDKPSVFVRVAEGFQLQPVELGLRDGSHVEVTQGLKAGAQVASAGSFTLKSELGKGSASHAH